MKSIAFAILGLATLFSVVAMGIANHWEPNGHVFLCTIIVFVIAVTIGSVDDKENK